MYQNGSTYHLLTALGGGQQGGRPREDKMQGKGLVKLLLYRKALHKQMHSYIM